MRKKADKNKNSDQTDPELSNTNKQNFGGEYYNLASEPFVIETFITEFESKIKSEELQIEHSVRIRIII